LKERTIRKRIDFKGIGLHSGQESTVVVEPAEEGTGIIFHKYPEDVQIPAHYENLHSINRGVNLGKGNAVVMTVEHLLSALWGCGVDNAYIVVDGPEIPGLDGSAYEFSKAIMDVGIIEQAKDREYLEIRKPINIASIDFTISAFPSREFEVSYGIQYSGHPLLSYQYAYFRITPETYFSEISKARTFLLEEEVNTILSSGLGRGGSLDNVVVVGRNEFKAKGGLYYPDEPVRHKILDLIGDIALLGKRVRGKLVLERAGHRAHLELVKELDKLFGGANFSVYDILKVMPHRYPFLLVDKIESLTEKKVVGIKNVTINEPFFQGHFPEFPVMPGVLIIEAMAQVGGFLILKRVKDVNNVLVLFAGIDNARFRKPVKPGDTLIIEAELLRFGGKMAKVRAVAKCQGEVVAEAELMAQITEVER
jgi:UDP-3-O-[3-hydroxymyristoyl] N-acetylglucosamine deacetylase/3-hydroxyacyl-[acyl-carrier-protein] dehydratase